MKNRSKKLVFGAGAIFGLFAAVAYSAGAYTWQTVGGATGKFYNGVNSLDAVYDLGKVGIGTTTPAFDLHVVGTTNLGGDVYHEGSRVNIGGKWTDGATTTQAVYQSGYVGIGLNNPLDLLHVSGTDDISARIASTGANSKSAVSLVNDARIWLLQNEGASSDSFQIYDQTAGTARMTFESTGDIGIGLTNPTVELEVVGTITSDEFIYSSDLRLKENLSDLDNYLDVLKLSPKSFTWKEDGAEDIGLIAQDVERYFPGLVVERGDGYKGVNYQKLIVPMLAVMKDQQTQIEELKKEIEELKK